MKQWTPKINALIEESKHSLGYIKDSRVRARLHRAVMELIIEMKKSPLKEEQDADKR